MTEQSPMAGTMSSSRLDSRVEDDLRNFLQWKLASDVVMTPARMDQHLATFWNRFGPAVLRGLDGEALLRRMHGRQGEDQHQSLAYWLEYKNDDEFEGYSFGSIAGGSAAKFGLYQRQSDAAWVMGLPNEKNVIRLDAAIAKAQNQRNELLAGDAVLAAMDPHDTSDVAYGRLQDAMKVAAPELHGDGWAHKYWFLIHPARLDDYHSPRYQRFHLFKLLQTPPDSSGILDGGAPRFLCAGRFAAAAREFGIPIPTLTDALNRRHGNFHRYWRVGTTAGDTDESEWAVMRDGGFISIGWKDIVPDLRDVLRQDRASAKEQVRTWLEASGAIQSASVVTRKAGEIINFAQDAAENDIVLAAEGQTVLGIGRIKGPYDYDEGLTFPHKRPVEWLRLESWWMPEAEGPRTAFFELGKKAANLIGVERRLFQGGPPPVPAGNGDQVASLITSPLPTLHPVISRIEQVLHRKGQVLLYGPPGTGKTYWALRAVRELAARQVFRKTFEQLDPAERAELEGVSGLVRVCTFHPGYGYEDFVEGLRPRTASGHMVFEPRDGLFKLVCADAARQPNRGFYIVVDEFNRGDVPRIFGELLTILERDKRGMEVVLPVTGDPFAVPPNVFLIGTMNTADRSISLLDAALRRRFGFIELMPDSAQLHGRKVGGLPLGPWLDALNARLRRHLKRDARNLQVGHAYLMPHQPITSIAEFARVLRDDLVPLLEEYCYDDFAMLGDILGSTLVDVQAGRIRDERFDATAGDALIQALRFEEMEQFALPEDLVDADPAADPEAESSEDGEDGAGPNA